MKLSPAILAASIALFSPYLAAEEVFVAAVGLKQGPFVGEIPVHLEEISLAYQSIAVTSPAGGRTASDSANSMR